MPWKPGKRSIWGVDKYDAMINFCENGNYTYEYLNDDAVLCAYNTVKQIADPSYSVKGSEGFQHTPAQQDFLRGAAVFMPTATGSKPKCARLPLTAA